MTPRAKLIFKAPVLTASGYGTHSRQLLDALVSCGMFDVSVRAITWGQTPFLISGEEFERISALAKKGEVEMQAGTTYDVSVQVTIPNEFERMATVNVGVTAGIEVDRVSPEWIVKCNENVDLVVVPSRHAAQTMTNTQYVDPQGKVLRLEKPVMLAPEGVDTRVFNPTVRQVDGEPRLARVDTRFNFLTVGLGLERGQGEDRKNISNLVRWFCERFKDDRDVGLIMKVGLVGNSLIDFDMTRSRLSEIKRMAGCQEFPRLYLVHGRLTDDEMADLYRDPKVKAFVTLTHGEGFGLPILEAAACDLPVVATDWSGHIDFLSVDGHRRFVPVEHDLAEIPESARWKGVMEQGSRWANPREEDAKAKMRKLTLSYDKPKSWAVELGEHVRRTYDVRKTNYDFATNLVRFLHEHRPVPKTQEDVVATVRRQLDMDGQLGMAGKKKSLLYTMPMSAGDVLISTAVVNGLRKKHPDHVIFFATDERYATLLEGDPDIDRILKWEPWMQDVPLLERIFDQVYTPNLAIQTVSSNWVRGGKGRLLADEMAAQCQVELGEYYVRRDDGVPLLTKSSPYVVLHPGSGKGQWEARSYLHWQEVVDNIRGLWGVEVVQVGQVDDPLYAGVTDYRGKTTYAQLASVIYGARCLVGIDTVSMHMAAALGTPHVAIFGSSYSTSTGPVYKKDVPHALLETRNRYTCDKACYKYQCSVDKDHPCVNEIRPRDVVACVGMLLNGWTKDDALIISEGLAGYREHRPRIAGYTHVLDAESQGFPYRESILSMLGFCDSVVVVDGGSTDGTLEALREIEKRSEGRVKVHVHPWDREEPGMDGQQKAFARAMCEGDFLWQQDADEVVHEDDYQKVRDLAKRFPRDVDIVDLPVVELWGPDGQVRTDRHSWKWRLSRNNFRITHGINKDARVFDERTGRTYAKKGMSDGCEYVDVMTGEFISHRPLRNFYNQDVERLRQTDPEAYGREMNRVFGELPCVFHYSWSDLPRKIRGFKRFWNRQWSTLYRDETPVDRFPDVDEKDPASVEAKARELLARGGEHGPAPTFRLGRTQPKSMRGG